MNSKTASADDLEFTKAWLDKARTDLFQGKARAALEQVARFSENPEAKNLAKDLTDTLYKMEKILAAYLNNNPDLSRKPPEVRLASTGASPMSLRSELVKLAHENPNTRPHLIPLLDKYACDCGGDDVMAGREHGESGKGYGMTGPDVRGEGKWTPEAKGKCYYETGDPADRCYVTQNGGPGGQTKPGPSTKPKDWKEYEKQRWGK